MTRCVAMTAMMIVKIRNESDIAVNGVGRLPICRSTEPSNSGFKSHYDWPGYGWVIQAVNRVIR